MKKTIFIALAIILKSILCEAQNWDTVGCRGFGSECGGFTYQANCLMVYNGALYICGSISGPISNSTPLNNIAKWNGTAWDSLQSGTPSCGGPNTMVVYNGNLIVGGTDMYKAGRVAVNNIASWNGSTWTALGTGISVRGWIGGMAVYNGNLYVIGSFDTAGGIPVNNIAMWNGVSWSAVGTGISGNGWALLVFNNTLYVGGDFDTAGGSPVRNIASWDGANWVALPGGGVNGSGIGTLAIYNNTLYAGGPFDSAGSVRANSIAQWNGTTWSNVGSGVIGASARVATMQVLNGDLFVGGIFDSAGGIPVENFAMWDGTTWHFASGFTGGDGPPTNVCSMAVYNGALFACGNFDHAGGIIAVDIADFYSATGISELSINDKIRVSPNPFSSNTTILFNSEGKYYLEVDDMTGRKLQWVEFNGTQYNLSMEGFSKGIYFLRAFDNARRCISTAKLVLE